MGFKCSEVVELLMLSLYAVSCMDVNVIRQEDGDIFNSSSNINCSIYNAKQISPSKCQCVFYGKFVNKKVFGSLYENAFGYSRCFYDKGASLGKC